MIEKWIPQYQHLSESTQQLLLKEFNTLNIEEIETIYENVYLNPAEVDIKSIKEVPYVSQAQLNKEEQERLSSIAHEAAHSGEIAVLLMAGGQGTRLEHPGPKGTFSFEGVSLFELQARQIREYKNDSNLPVHWYIMTSDINHDDTIQFFEHNDYFDLPKSNIHFFKQEHFPPLSKEGNLLLTEDKEIMLAPNGNGGVFSSLWTSGMLKDMESRGVTHVFMNNVDNAVVKVMDPLLLGFHIDQASEVTSKSITPKQGESVGRLSLVDGHKGVVEYTELPEGTEDNFTNGNIGIHVFSLGFLKDVAQKEMPYHLALKKLEFLDEDLNLIKDEALKFEKFYFDAFKFADNHNTLQVDRTGEFSPLKNKEGKDSIETAYHDLKNEGLI